MAAPATGAATGAENPLAFLRYLPPPLPPPPGGLCCTDPDPGFMVNPYPEADLRRLAVLRIRVILVRIRIRGSVPLIKADPAVFVIELQDANKKQFFFLVFLLITF